jgi:16S rRNA (cytosine1402-N4)-methyltransferase
MYHIPVLLKESIEGLRIRSGGVYVDATFGGGGHSAAILREMDGGRLFAFDRDPDARVNNIDDPRLLLINADYRYIKNYLRLHNAIPCDGILADLGISSHQIDTPERGFSTRQDGRLDMRMDSRIEQNAADIINAFTEGELENIFRMYGEIANSRQLARAICQRREQERIGTTTALAKVAGTCAARGQENKYLARVFQALRIVVNEELESLGELLMKSLEVLKPGGRLVVISYHSLEDRMVKNFIKSGNLEGKLEKDFYGNLRAPFIPVNRKVISAPPEENLKNPRARSAKLRIAERTEI